MTPARSGPPPARSRQRATQDTRIDPDVSARDDATPGDRRATALRSAARAKHEAALQRAEKGLRRLLKDGDEITFRSVARAGSVSLDFLYAQPDLRRRIEGLRERQEAAGRPSRTARFPEEESEGNVLRTLAAQLRDERSRRVEQVRELEAKLAAAHGEILQLRRRVEGGEHTG